MNRLMLLGSAAVVASCTPKPPSSIPVAPIPASTIDGQSLARRRPRVTASQRLADQIHSFGGAFIEGGVLHIYLTTLADSSIARGFIQPQLAAQRRPEMRVQFIQGDYSFRDMESWAEKLAPLMGRPGGISSIGIDEWKNRLRIGVVNREARSAVESAIRTLNLPVRAIIVEDMPYGIPTMQHD